MSPRSARPLLLGLLLAAGPLSAAPAPRSHQPPPKEDDWEAPPADRDRKSPLAPTPETLLKGRALFQANCVRCHGDKGRGDGPGAASLPAKPADLTDPIFQRLLTDGEIFWKISNGRWRGKEVLMPAMAEKIPGEEDRWRVVAFVRSLAAR